MRRLTSALTTTILGAALTASTVSAQQYPYRRPVTPDGVARRRRRRRPSLCLRRPRHRVQPPPAPAPIPSSAWRPLAAPATCCATAWITSIIKNMSVRSISPRGRGPPEGAQRAREAGAEAGDRACPARAPRGGRQRGPLRPEPAIAPGRRVRARQAGDRRRRGQPGRPRGSPRPRHGPHAQPRRGRPGSADPACRRGGPYSERGTRHGRGRGESRRSPRPRRAVQAPGHHVGSAGPTARALEAAPDARAAQARRCGRRGQPGGRAHPRPEPGPEPASLGTPAGAANVPAAGEPASSSQPGPAPQPTADAPAPAQAAPDAGEPKLDAAAAAAQHDLLAPLPPLTPAEEARAQAKDAAPPTRRPTAGAEGRGPGQRRGAGAGRPGAPQARRSAHPRQRPCRPACAGGRAGTGARPGAGERGGELPGPGRRQGRHGLVHPG